jgi:hypothetical protein
MKVEKIEILFSISIDYRPNEMYIGLITQSDVNAHRLNDDIEGQIQISYRSFEYSDNVLIVVNFIKDNSLIRTIDGTFSANNDKIIELISALDNKKVTHLFVGYPNIEGKNQRVGQYYPVSYLTTE